jgi:hypothetical protein
MYLITFSAFLPLIVHSIRLAVFNDIHLDLTYTLPCNWRTAFCYDLGIYEQNPPPALF